MYILLALIAACSLGIGLHYLMPGRELRGVAVAPGVATATAAAVYTIMQWAGVGEDSVWLWVAAIGGGIVLAALLTLTLGILRARGDEKARAALGI
ncbi:hypothetical protein [Microbacterium soli]|uniref:Uncharacterized protein n=1 Tax=Microbacterium soli TaxID=446075 RepID=A0ABP7MQ83_9MICO